MSLILVTYKVVIRYISTKRRQKVTSPLRMGNVKAARTICSTTKPLKPLRHILPSIHILLEILQRSCDKGTDFYVSLKTHSTTACKRVKHAACQYKHALPSETAFTLDGGVGGCVQEMSWPFFVLLLPPANEYNVFTPVYHFVNRGERGVCPTPPPHRQTKGGWVGCRPPITDADLPRQTPSPIRQQAGGTNPTGIHTCFLVQYLDIVFT